MSTPLDALLTPNWKDGPSRAGLGKRWSAYPGDVLDLGVAEMDLTVCPAILTAVRDAVARGTLGYPVPDEHSDVPRVSAAWLAALGLSVPAEGIRLVPDVLRGITVAIRRLTRPGSPVLIPTPTYSRFLEIAEVTDRELIEVPLLTTPSGWRLDLDAIERGFAAGAGSVLLCNPINPVGAVLDPEHLTELSTLVERAGTRVISDEVHAPIRYDVPFTPYAAVNSPSRAHAVTVTSATKAWNFPGLRTAIVALTNPDDQRVWNGLAHLETSGASPLGQIATVAALTEGQPWLDATLRDLDTHRHLAGRLLAEAGLTDIYRAPDATYFAWLDLRAWEPARPAARLLTTARVALGEGALYGRAGEGFVRVNLATAPTILTEALQRIIDAITH